MRRRARPGPRARSKAAPSHPRAGPRRATPRGVAERISSRWWRAASTVPYLEAITSPCSVSLMRPSTVPAGWARIARWVGAAAAGDRAAAAVEELEAHALLPRLPGELALDLLEGRAGPRDSPRPSSSRSSRSSPAGACPAPPAGGDRRASDRDAPSTARAPRRLAIDSKSGTMSTSLSRRSFPVRRTRPTCRHNARSSSTVTAPSVSLITRSWIARPLRRDGQRRHEAERVHDLLRVLRQARLRHGGPSPPPGPRPRGSAAARRRRDRRADPWAGQISSERAMRCFDWF